MHVNGLVQNASPREGDSPWSVPRGGSSQPLGQAEHSCHSPYFTTSHAARRHKGEIGGNHSQWMQIRGGKQWGLEVILYQTRDHASLKLKVIHKHIIHIFLSHKSCIQMYLISTNMCR